MGATDLGSVANHLRELNTDLRGASSQVYEALKDLESANDRLSELDDPHAANARADIAIAVSELREILAVWTNDYQRRSDELSRKIVS